MGKRGRKVGDVIKDLRYEEWFGVSFKFDNENYILCKPDGKYTFRSLQRENIEGLNVIKYTERSEAESAISLLPEIVMGGYARDIEVVSSKFLSGLV